MIRIKEIIIVFFVLTFSITKAQDIKVDDNDFLLKERIYEKNKKKVLNYSMKQFDALFFEFSDKKSNANLVLTKEEFYNYTIQIAIFSDRLASLYPDEKEIAEKSKEKWFAESYEDYLLSKVSQKK
ncbi:hypothetical protein LNP27_02740 [Flavobacterium galactosidilyticum]|uniref:hypothetical protein n=1 Tax=Flavobacterium galactosidilyticum TaxID=2893886 RepID=UPI001E5D3EA2|nr:hypothetical protein [Flavobacterium sp. F-340]UFH46969.1 hypothetical protein LNP27_02740 [Flavobacterium sp. F-340]